MTDEEKTYRQKLGELVGDLQVLRGAAPMMSPAEVSQRLRKIIEDFQEVFPEVEVPVHVPDAAPADVYPKPPVPKDTFDTFPGEPDSALVAKETARLVQRAEDEGLFDADN